MHVYVREIIEELESHCMSAQVIGGLDKIKIFCFCYTHKMHHWKVELFCISRTFSEMGKAGESREICIFKLFRRLTQCIHILMLLCLPSVMCLSCSHVYHWTALPLLLDSTWHMPISQYLADVPLFVTFLFKPCFPHSCCPFLSWSHLQWFVHAWVNTVPIPPIPFATDSLRYCASSYSSPWSLMLSLTRLDLY